MGDCSFDEPFFTPEQEQWLRDNPAVCAEMRADAVRVAQYLDAEDVFGESAGRLADRLERLYNTVPANPEIDQRRYETATTVTAGFKYLRTGAR
jgi:hypothetical protein